MPVGIRNVFILDSYTCTLREQEHSPWKRELKTGSDEVYDISTQARFLAAVTLTIDRHVNLAALQERRWARKVPILGDKWNRFGDNLFDSV